MNDLFKNKGIIYSKSIFAVTNTFMIFLCILFDYIPIFTKIEAILCVLYSVYLCYIYRFNIGLFIVMIFIAYTNYSISMAVYIKPSIRPEEFYCQFSSDRTLTIGIVCIHIFLSFMILLSSDIIKCPKKICSKENIIKNSKPNKLIEFFAPIVYLFIFFMNFDLGDNGARGGSTAFGEYRIIVAIIGAYFSEKNNKNKAVWIFTILITSIMIFISKNRVDAIPSLILLLIYWLPTLFDYKKVILLLPLSVVFFASIGFFRGISNGLDTIRFYDTIKEMQGQGLTYVGAIFAYMPALATVQLSPIIPSGEKINLLVKHIIYIFEPVAAGDSNPDLSTWSRNYYTHCYVFIFIFGLVFLDQLFLLF